MDLLVRHRDTQKLQFRNSLQTEPFGLPYSYFKRFAVVIYGEMGRYENSENEAKAIGCTIVNAIRMHFLHFPSPDNLVRVDKFLTPSYTQTPKHGAYKGYLNLSCETILKTLEKRTALLSVLYALLDYGLNNVIDVSNSATHWDGGDFAQKGIKQDKPLNNGIYVANEVHLIDYARYWNTIVEKDKTRLKMSRGGEANKTSNTLVKVNTSENYELALSPNPYPALGANKGRALYISVAQYGATICWAPNYNGPLNNGYEWKYIINY